MIAQVVPITRLRRDTTWWSYKIPARQTCSVGSLVIVPFRGHPSLGVVWHIEETDAKAKETITEILTSIPLLKNPHRQLIEWLSLQGLCSLSTALYTWIPTALHALPLSSATHKLLAEYNTLPITTHTPKQHSIVVPGYRPEQTRLLKKKFDTHFQELFGDSQELESWFQVLQAQTSLGLGREKALFAPWNNLQQITLIDPEDIAYYHEQIPYLSLVEAALEQAKLSGAQVSIRSHLPQAALELLWPGENKSEYRSTSFELIKITIDTLLNPELIEKIRTTTLSGKKTLILYNARDRMINSTRNQIQETIRIPGIETLAKRLAHFLGESVLPESIILGTRSIFQKTYENVGLTIILSLDPLLDETSFANLMHGLSDIGHLTSYQVPCIIQTRNPTHPLVQALLMNKLEDYAVNRIIEQKEAHLPPFGQHIVCSYPGEEEAELVESTFQKIADLAGPTWHVSHPFSAPWRKKPFQHILLHTPETTTRLPIELRTYLVKLPRPWKIQRNPWYLL